MSTEETPAVKTYPVAPRLQATPTPHIGPDLDAYRAAHKGSVGEGSDEWWGEKARELLYWDRPFKTIRSGGFATGDIAWFPEGGLNVSYNAVDRWAFEDPDRIAIIYEADEPDGGCSITYGELLRQVSSLANVLSTTFGVRPGDTVSIYLPTTWHAAVALLACARIGAIHSVVFAGFSAEALRDRINDCQSRVLITCDEGRRGGKAIATKAIADAALEACHGIVEHVLVLKRTGGKINWTEGRDRWWDEEMAKVPKYCPPRVMSAEDPLFILYTSGSTGKPKGVVHTSGGYALCAALTVKYVFDVHKGDRFACMADVGWITGHTYIVYGPLLNGVTTLMFESTPVYPTPARYWEVVAKHKLTQFYNSPTAIRLLRRLGAHHVEPHDLSSLRVLGSVGEPINPEAWEWYHEHAGRGQCAIVDTFWQTETGSIVLTPFPGAVPTKPGSATVAFFGHEPVILDAMSGTPLEGNNVEGVLALGTPWPSIARTIWRDHARYLDTYMKPYPGLFYTGDGAARDEDGYIWIKGRVDDVINVSGHRLSTAEIESALIMHKGVAETAVIGTADELTGQAVYSFVTLKPEFSYDSGNEAGLVKELVLQVRKVIGPFAAPKKIYIVPDLPKTRSGKIMRRIMRKIVAGEGDQLGDLSTIAEPSTVDAIKQKVAEGNA
ncbi:Acetyl-coenzyme A synthetase [Mycena indigotica]|uniref:Acetyl-coenzyme A synthetase n=1 Tax=Mycena indigotica TaxID=2126181 RepID=A0A8H6SSM1_9AGAR|nr:Acetyl-coenzyme A synthetase [Mycena indigotica]KAF7303941.1 Acetyl-coenzyme A synthetase [Mycena indigotica]